MIGVYLIDGHDVVREGLCAILSREPDIEIAGWASSGDDALAELPILDPDVVVIDHRLPGMDGIALCRELAERRVRAQAVVLSGLIDGRVVESAFLAGARAYVLKDVEASELAHAIRAAARGETVIDPGLTTRSVTWAAYQEPVPEGTLSAQQRCVLRHLIDGKSSRQIADATGLSPNTVRSYLKTIYRRLGVSCRAEATSVVLRRGLV